MAERTRAQRIAAGRENLLGIVAANRRDDGGAEDAALYLDSLSAGSFDFGREIGATHKLHSARIQDNIVNNPAEFLRAKRQDYEEQVKLAERFANEAYHKNLHEYHYSSDVAKSKAIAAGKAYFSELMKMHEEQFPDSLASAARGKTVVGVAGQQQ